MFHVYFLELSCSFSKFFRLDTCIRFGLRSLEKIALPMHTNLRTVIGLRQKDNFIVRSETIHLSHPRSTSPITTQFSKTVDLWKFADQKMWKNEHFRRDETTFCMNGEVNAQNAREYASVGQPPDFNNEVNCSHASESGSLGRSVWNLSGFFRKERHLRQFFANA